MQMIPTRIFFQKTGRAKYISHLDTMRTMTRAFKRSGLPLWYTEGFNPHLYSTFPLPIALGYESMCESVDVRLLELLEPQHVVDRLNRALPPGFQATTAAGPVMDAATITWADYSIQLYYSSAQLAKRAQRLQDFLTQEAIDTVKKTKKGERVVDLKPLSSLLSLQQGEEALALTLRLASGNTQNINPTLFLKAFHDWDGAEPERTSVLRTAIYNDRLELFC